MSRATVDQTWCDLCGYGGGKGSVAEWQEAMGIDLCR